MVIQRKYEPAQDVGKLRLIIQLLPSVIPASC